MYTARLEHLDMLGPASVDAGKLARFAADSLQLPEVKIRSARAVAIPVPFSNMTTGGLWRIQGTAAAAPSTPAADFKLVVNLLQSPLLWSDIDRVPESFRGQLERGYPWRTEAMVYASELVQVFPEGGRLPRIYGIEELGPQRAAIWMEDVAECTRAGWGDAQFLHAAALLGRLAGDHAIRGLGSSLQGARDADRLRLFVESVGTMLFIPRLMGEELWRVPAVAEAATPQVTDGLRLLASRAPALVDEIGAIPALAAHGDASPQNLLVESLAGGPGGSTGFAVIDWGMFGMACAGFDLGQLLAGLVNQGTMHGRELYGLEPLCLGAYCDGLAESGANTPVSVVKRGHALSMALFTGLSAVASPDVDGPESDELHATVNARMEMARFVLDLLQSTD